MTQEDKAIIKLKSILDLSETKREFKEIFFTQLHEGKDKKAINILLELCYYFLSSDGEVFNEVVRSLGGDKAKEMKKWINDLKDKYA